LAQFGGHQEAFPKASLPHAIIMMCGYLTSRPVRSFLRWGDQLKMRGLGVLSSNATARKWAGARTAGCLTFSPHYHTKQISRSDVIVMMNSTATVQCFANFSPSAALFSPETYSSAVPACRQECRRYTGFIISFTPTRTLPHQRLCHNMKNTAFRKRGEAVGWKRFGAASFNRLDSGPPST
jgi:hypothetical protein